MTELNIPVPENLTEKQRMFCEAYVMNGGNGSAAVREAKYNCTTTSTWSSLAFTMLTNSDIIAYIETLRKALRQNFGVTAEEVIGGLREVRARALQSEAVFDADGNPIGDYKCDLGAANRAIELLGKTRGMFVDKQEITIGLDDLAAAMVKLESRIEELL